MILRLLLLGGLLVLMLGAIPIDPGSPLAPIHAVGASVIEWALSLVRSLIPEAPI